MSGNFARERFGMGSRCFLGDLRGDVPDPHNYGIYSKDLAAKKVKHGPIPACYRVECSESGKKYVGEWEDGMPNGHGTFTPDDGNFRIVRELVEGMD